MGAFEVHGAIFAQYQASSEHRGALGYPISDERAWIAGGGRVSHFQYGSIFYTDAAGVTVSWSPGLV
jgi:uncharacterized protein with LGFP repeats